MNKGPAPLVFELFGQPGSGKTTLAQAAASSGLMSRADLAAAWACRSRLAKATFAARALLDPPSVARSAQLVAQARLTSADSLLRLARLVARSEWMRLQGRPLLLSEGSLQDLWSIFYSAKRLKPDPALLAPFIRAIYRRVEPRIICIDVDPETALARIIGRVTGQSRLDRLDEAALRRRLTDTAELPRRIADAARMAALQVETLDGSAPLGRLIEQLDAIIAAARSQAAEAALVPSSVRSQLP
jgi:dephospho-CoA kinase